MPQKIVLDTNILLDLFVFSDAATRQLHHRLMTRELQWLATQPMRDELARVLSYPKIVPRLVHYQRTAQFVLGQFDSHAMCVDVAPRAHLICKDPDDQKFIDLAVLHLAQLLSKDNAVLRLSKRMGQAGVRVSPVFAD